MTYKILFAGFGGQGILFAGKQLARFGMDAGKTVTWMPSYGPEQRGGTCNCSVIVSDEDISCPIIESPDIVVAFNVQSFEKFEPKIARGGILFADSTLIDKRSERTDIDCRYIPATEIVNELGAGKLTNVVMLGYIMKVTGIFDPEEFGRSLTDSLPPSKAALAELNSRCYKAGLNYGE